MLETRIVEGMTGKLEEQKLQPVDSLTFLLSPKSSTKNTEALCLEEQKNLLNNYISSFSQDDLEAKIYFNRELGRLKQSLSEATKGRRDRNDPEMIKKNSKPVRERLETLSKETKLNEVYPADHYFEKHKQLVKEITTMPITVRIVPIPEPIKVTIKPKAPPPTVTLELDIRKSLSGDLMIFDHGDLDIVLSGRKIRRLLPFPKAD